VVSEEPSVEKIAKELVKAVQVLPWLGYALFGVVAIYIAAIFATWTFQWVMVHWERALIIFAGLILVMAYFVWEEA